MSFQLSGIKDAYQHLMLYIPTSLPQEQAAKTSVVSIRVLCTVEEGVANASI